eukprot:TRINITY_DN345_c0_g1_i9.p1 TRINITY_DN345_c0_g1~~TRINITY_DN345_c0_g1_i9.p1  ORF type:complete len:154 (+),score=27.01 TRINITY_DN345_c0_g1_i9:111-572(+)
MSSSGANNGDRPPSGRKNAGKQPDERPPAPKRSSPPKPESNTDSDEEFDSGDEKLADALKGIWLCSGSYPGRRAASATDTVAAADPVPSVLGSSADDESPPSSPRAGQPLDVLLDNCTDEEVDELVTWLKCKCRCSVIVLVDDDYCCYFLLLL